MPSKFDEEIASAMDTGKNAITNLKYNIKANAPDWVVKPITGILVDERTPAFLLGMGFEAAGIAIQQALNIPVYPILDGIVAMIMIALLMWYQRRKRA